MVGVLAMLLADGRFPAGSYAHSLGLEQAVADGLEASGVAGFIGARLRLVAEPEARIALAARRGACSDGVEGALVVDEEFAARCPSPVLRDSARRLGGALLRSAAAVWPAEGGSRLARRGAPAHAPAHDGALIRRYRDGSASTPRPVALGVVAAATGLGDEELTTLALYDDAATVASAALKLLALDPAHASRWVAQLAPWIEDTARLVAADARPLAEQSGPAAIGLELAAAVHHARRERLFVS